MNEITNITENFFEFITGSLIGLLAWFFGGLDELLQVLLALVVIDYISGTCVAWLKGTISSSIGFKGILKKCIMLTLVGISHLLDTILPGDSNSVRTVVCILYISTECISLIENADSLGIPVPQVLRDRLLHLKQEHDHIQDNKENSESEIKEVKEAA